MSNATEHKLSAQEILNRKVLLLDGGLGTTLEDEHNVKFSSQETPLWSSHLLISSPETLLKVQTDFVDAGADVVLTATYQASFAGIANTPAVAHWNQAESHEPPSEAKALLTSAVGISRTAIQSSAQPGLVALSLGAYGATLVPSQEYTGKYGTCDLVAFHSSRLNTFLEDATTWKNIDVIAYETLPRLDEVQACRVVMSELSKNGSDDKPYWISCVFPHDDTLPDGSTIEDVVNAMLAGNHGPTPYAIGINCTKVHKISTLVKKFEDAAGKLGLVLPRLVIYPDGADGLVYDTTAQKWVGDGSEETSWDEQVYQIVRDVLGRGKWAGVLVGGCCKTAPGHIAKLRRRLDAMGSVEASHGDLRES